jgi:hypothetical protein
VETRLQPRFEREAVQLGARKDHRRFRFLAKVIGLGSILFLPGWIFAQEHAPAQSAEHYTTTKTWIPTDALALNDDGVVLGRDFVIYKDRSIQLLGPYGDGRGSILVSVNNRGQVLLVQAHDGLHYFLYDPIRKDMTPVGQNGKVAEGGTIRTVHLVYLTKLDDDGRVYGVYGTPHGPCAVVGTPTLGTPGDLGQPPAALADFTLIGCPGGGDLRIRAINSKGQMTGGVKRQGFIWSDGKLSIFSFPGAFSTEGYAINDAGVVAGVFMIGNRVSENGDVSGHFTPGLPPPQKGFIYDGTNFRLLSFPNSVPVYVSGINNHGQVVGHYKVREEDNRGFIAESEKLPVAHMEATAAELTGAAVGRRETSAPAPCRRSMRPDHCRRGSASRIWIRVSHPLPIGISRWKPSAGE